MKNIFKLFCIISLIFLLVLILFGVIWFKKSTINFDVSTFLSNGYTSKQIYDFCNIGFPNGRIWKWEREIKVELIDINSFSKNEIANIDTVISIVAPLIYPIKIKKVESKGNFRIYTNKHEILSKNKILGLCIINPINYNYFPLTFNLISVDMYLYDAFKTHTLMHEFLHGLGLDHPTMQHVDDPMILSVGTKFPNYFKSLDESYEFMDNKFYISEAEMNVLRMLYSSGLKSGLYRSVFMKKLNLKY